MNYTKIRIVVRGGTVLYISEDELDVFKLSGDYEYIEYLNDEGQCHRTDGPAVEYVGGGKMWYQRGLRHRLDGPAMEWGWRASGYNDWWVHGRQYSKQEFERRFK